jgi:hypothetical protein
MKLSKQAQAALTSVLEPGEEVRASADGDNGGAVVLTDRRVHVFRRLLPIGGGKIQSWPAHEVRSIEYQHGRNSALIVNLVGEVRRAAVLQPNYVSAPISAPGQHPAREDGVRELQAALIEARERHPGDWPPSEGPLGELLASATIAWTLPTVSRTYEGTDAGRWLLGAETEVFGRHGYSPTLQSEVGGHFHAGRILLTGGLSVLAGSPGTRSKGSMTATFTKASSPTSAPPDPPASASPGPDAMDQIRRLGELREAGFLTGEEFAAKKAELLSRL